MRICIDARWIFRELSGIGTYTQELIRHLAGHDRENEYVLLFQTRRILSHTARETNYNTAPNFHARVFPYGPFSLWGQWGMRRELADINPDVYHAPNYMIPFPVFGRKHKASCKCVVTLHDLIPLMFPEQTPRAKKVRFLPLFRWIMREVGHRADVILTVSESSCVDIIRELEIQGGNQGKVVVVPNGVAGHFELPSRHHKQGQRILYVGRFDPYKNVTILIEAFASLRKQALPDATLRIIGPPDKRYPEAHECARSLGVYDQIEWSGYVKTSELVKAYQTSDVTVLPSRYEGFGLPVLESMACGTPVVCSNTSSLPEAAGDAGVLVPPGDPLELAKAIEKVLTDIPYADDLRRKGLERAAVFTWERSAELSLDAYRLAMDSG